MYHVLWVAKKNPWRVGKGLVDMPAEMGEAGEEPLDPPVMKHAEVTLKRK